ncbi:nucleotidyl transferase AbiEii/AbiGii toxin family protein [Pseudomonas fluorescens]|uniref:nucleotidyl transferase AbiEii/AbiGii toxin family protein n=1 Tax=Pseudomonas TaxID=286 RepID=UPI000F038BC1|nr:MULTISPECIES: nucleotidyl transferase AbiEii/AbiGii toxin family protein [Pseudomonas]MBD8089199.1 nucleotidyl transferase AbiEii/AbiGii toxin family protein [Pseudomonas fluorescens]MBD8615374.1 nucleotidyl transferase AbiEii/AbiGii toxin family protein [Pseudomonas putida]MBD8681972.1 nucleotidyl transferase AbiEii/AbiGii toxin family protein [Pseudomonas sp. CFBP 13719]
MKIAFSQLLEQAQAQSNGAPPDVVVKELLHYDILKALSDSDLAREVTFQGGSALRLFYSGQRYSEDLDFVIGAGENKGFVIDGMVELLKKQMTDRYGLELEVKPPSKNEFNGIDVRTWQFKISIPGFLRKQMIKVEFCNVPAHDVGAKLMKPRYGFLDDTHSAIMLRVESEQEIMADKLTAIANRKYLKARDLWDLKFLSDRGVTPDFELVRKKLSDYGAQDFAQKLEESIARLRDVNASSAFMTEMEKFVSPSIVKGLRLMKPPGQEYIQFALGHMINLQQVLVPQKATEISPSL